MNKSRNMVAVTVTAALLLLTGVAVAPGQTLEGEAGLDSVTLQLKWLNQFQFAGYYAAVEKGYYREAGLKVKIVPAKPDTEPMEEVLKGRADFGVGTTDVVLLRAKGKPVVVLAVIFQHSPLVLLVRRDAGIEHLHDLEGKRVMIEPHSAELFAYLKNESIPPSSLKITPHTFSPEDLIAGKVDAMSAYSTDEPFDLLRAGVDFLVFTPRSGGIDFYGDCLFTTEDRIRRHPKRVKAFRQASLRGWDYALENPEEIVDIILSRYVTQKSKEHLLFEAAQMRRLIYPDLIAIGYMNPGRWRHIADTYAQLGMIRPGFPIDGLLYKGHLKRDLSRLYWILAGSLTLLLVVGLVSLRVYRLNRRLQQQIRKREETEGILRESEERYRGIYDTAPLAFALWNREYEITDWNRQAEEIFGWSRSEVLGRNFLELLIPESERGPVESSVEKLLQGERQAHYSLNNLTKGGQAIVCEWNNSFQTDDGGNIVGVISLALDITQRIRIQTLYELAVAMTATRGLDAKLDLVVRRIRDLLKTDTSFVAMHAGRTEDLYLHALAGIRTEEFKRIRIPRGRGLGGKVVGTGAGYIVQDYFEEIGASSQDVVRSEGLISGLATPIRMGATNLGVLYAANRDKTLFAQSDLETLSLIGKLLAVEIARSRAEDRLRETHDELESRVEERTAELLKANEDFRREIGERKRVERALGKSERKYRFLAENLRDVLWTTDLQLNTTYVSPSVHKVLGFTPEERMKQTVGEQLTPESLELAAKTLVEELGRDKEEGVALDRHVILSLDFTAKDGSVVCLETVMTFIRDENSNPVGIYGLSRDVTERRRAEQAVKESERRLAEIIDFLPDATFVIDKEGEVVAWNRAIEAMTGISTEEMTGKRDYEYAVPFYGERRPILIDLVNERNEEVEKKYLSIMEEGETLISESFHPDPAPDGIYLSSTARPLYDSQGNRVGAIESLRDITSRKRIEEALKQAKEAAESASRARGEFLANTSHEIRTPLNAVLGMIDLLLDTELTEQQRVRVHIIKSSADALLALLNDILDFSKIEAGKLDLEEIDFSIRAGLAGAVSLLQIRAQDKNLDLRYHIDDMIPDKLRGDPNRLRQILLNLANNAIKFTEEGEVVIQVGLQEKLDREVVIHFAVSDTGIGIPPDKLDSIFDRFSQTDSSTTRKYGGTGLGLAISFQLAMAMGGSIRVESELGKGSTFHFIVPFRLGESVEGTGASLTKGMEAITDLTGMKVLLAEDNVFNQAVAVEVLKKLGCEVVVTSNGREAVEAFESQPFDIVLMDLRMPGIDGFEATRLIRAKETTERTPIIAQTAHAFAEDRERCLEVGMDEHVPKPIQTGELLRVIQELAAKGKPRVAEQPARSLESATNDPAPEDDPCFDVSDLLDRLDGDRDTLKEMAEIFLSVMPGQIGELKDAAADNDWELVGQCSHSIKGACATFAAYGLRDTAGGIERAAEQRRSSEVQSLTGKLDRQFEELKQLVLGLGLVAENESDRPDS